MHLALALVALTGCELGNDPVFPGGGTDNTDTGNATDDSGDSGEVDDASPVIDAVTYEWEDFPNSDSGYMLNFSIEYTDAQDDLDGGQLMLWLDPYEESYDIGSNECRIEDGKLLLALDIEPDDYVFELKIKDAAGNPSEKVEVVVAP